MYNRASESVDKLQVDLHDLSSRVHSILGRLHNLKTQVEPRESVVSRQPSVDSVQLKAERNLLLTDVLRGFSATAVRNVLLLGTFFVFVDRLSHLDTLRRGAVSTTAAWILVWPLDVAKSQMQSASTATVPVGLWTSMSNGARDGTLYRGFGAGISRSLLANKASLRAYQFGQDMRTNYFSNPRVLATD